MSDKKTIDIDEDLYDDSFSDEEQEELYVASGPDEHNKDDDHVSFKQTIEEHAREDEDALSSNFTLRKILGGDILTADLLRRQIWLILLIVAFIIIYVANRYSCQKSMLEINKLNKELVDTKYKTLSLSSVLTERCRESHVMMLLRENNDTTLHTSDQPPYIIDTSN
ncbi:MAG: hypothetical protein IKX22_11070 [Prevotella sp.]|nr:hypothetical protein [Prevotella sp.]